MAHSISLGLVYGEQKAFPDAPPPSNLLQPPQRLETIQDPEEGQEGDADGGHGRDKDQSDLPIQVTTNAINNFLFLLRPNALIFR